MSTINLQGGNTLLTSGFFPPVRVASTGSPLNPSTGGLLTVDGVQLAAGDRVLCKDETSAVNNGIYAANTGPWVRTSDASTNQQFFSGMAVVCALGTVNAKSIFICTCTDDPVVVGTSLLTFAGQLAVGAGNVVGPGSSTPGDVATFADTSGQFLADTAVTGTGLVVKANSPALTTPNIGVATATRVNNVAITQPASAATLTLGSGKTVAISNSLTIAGTDGKTVTHNASTTFAGSDSKTLTIDNTLEFAGTDSTKFTFPGSSDTVVGVAATQTLTNKTLTSPTLTTPALGVATATTVTVTPTQAANTSVDGLILTDTTAATSGNQQFSPRLRLTGQGWKTAVTAGSQETDWIVENQPVQGSSAPTSNLVASSQINAGGYTALLQLSSAGALTVGAAGVGSGGALFLNGSSSGSFELLPNSTGGVLNIGSADITADNVGNLVAVNLKTNTFWATAPNTQTGSTYAVAATDYSIIANNSSGTLTLTLPTPSSNTGRVLKLKTTQNESVISASSNVVPLAGGAAGTAILSNTAGKWAELQCDGTSWIIMASN